MDWEKLKDIKPSVDAVINKHQSTYGINTKFCLVGNLPEATWQDKDTEPHLMEYEVYEVTVG